jgi:LysR family glycine cleavage system transcriptional activator
MPNSPLRLPPMDLIRSFVTVGRRMSITLAADELFVTQSAVSRQIHALEETLGVKLFVRGHRSIKFTPEGERLFLAGDSAVRQLQEVISSIRVVPGRRPVTLSVPIGFAGLWLLPRIGHFQQRHPEIDLRISAGARIVDLRGEDIDLAIRYCPAAAAPNGAIRLFGETLAPVAHPSLCDQTVTSAEQVSNYFFLEFDDPKRHHLQWEGWLNSMGWENTKPKGTLRFNQYDQVIQATLAGQGLAIGRLELVGTLLEQRRLIALAKPLTADRDYAHWLVQGDVNSREDINDVVAWICTQAAEMARDPSTHSSSSKS